MRVLAVIFATACIATGGRTAPALLSDRVTKQPGNALLQFTQGLALVRGNQPDTAHFTEMHRWPYWSAVRGSHLDYQHITCEWGQKWGQTKTLTAQKYRPRAQSKCSSEALKTGDVASCSFRTILLKTVGFSALLNSLNLSRFFSDLH